MDHIKNYEALNNIILYLQTHKDITFKYPNLHINFLKIISFLDVQFATKDDIRSEIGYFIFLTEKNNNVQPFYGTFYKSKEITRSVLGG